MSQPQRKHSMRKSECYVSGAVAVVLRMSRLAGLAPLNFEKVGSGWRVSLASYWTYYGYFIVTILIGTNVGSVLMDMQLEQEQSIRMKTTTRCVVWIVDVACLLLIATTGVLSAPAQMTKIIACIHRTEKINFDLKNQQWPTHGERRKIRLTMIWMVGTLALTLVDHGLTMDAINMNQKEIWINVMYSFYYCCYWIFQLRVLIFVILTLHVMYCFRTINDRLKTLLQDLSDDNELRLLTLFKGTLYRNTKHKLFNVNVSIVAGSTKTQTEHNQKGRKHHEIVRRLASAHGRTCDVVRELDEVHGLVLLMIMGSFLLHLVCTPYYAITCMFKQSSFLSQDTTDKTVYILVQVLWCFYHFINLLMVIEPCHLTQVEIETTCELVSHLLRSAESTQDLLGHELEMFSKHLFLCQPSYSAMQVTTISRSLVATILGSITTYLVMIIQL